jgi:hypothetical protein
LQAKLAERAKGRLTEAEARVLRASLQADRAKLAQLDALAADLSDEVVDSTRAAITARRTEASRRLRAGIHRGPLAGLPDTEAALAHAWDVVWSLDRRRAVLGELVKGIELIPVGRGRRATGDHILVDWQV